ncbi:MAG: GNAT family N-acetyltransferase [Bacteroidetes bacterium]|nr:GNAT family N-acetyltransferase [Bacteroidota bacterium]
MQQIIFPVSTSELLKELTDDKFVRDTNKAKNKIYIFSHHDSPNLMREVGRLREISFREAGGGTGNELDVDKFDTSEKPYKQLIVWDPKANKIVGGYRFILTKDAPKDKNGTPILATSRLFKFSDKFNNDYLPYIIELGRSFIQPDYQSVKLHTKSIFSLDNLWDGLGALIVDNPEIKYFFGKVTMYPHYKKEARNLLLFFINKYFNDDENLISLIKPLEINWETEKYNKLFSHNSYKENYKILSKKIRTYGENIPPLVNAYMNLSPNMKTFGTSINPHFGDVEETAILISIKDAYEAKINRHLISYRIFLENFKKNILHKSPNQNQKLN